MQLKALKRLGTPELTIYNGWKEFFNPLINLYWGELNQVRTKDYFAQIKAIHCRENLVNNWNDLAPQYTLNVRRSEQEPLKQAILSALDDDELYLLFYMGCQGMQDLKPEFVYYTASGTPRNNSNNTIYTGYVDQWDRSPFTVGTPEFKVWFKALVARYKTSWEGIQTRFPEAVYLRDNYPGYNEAMRSLHNMMLGGKIYSNQGGRAITASQVAEIMAADPENSALKVEMGPYGANLTLSQRITRANKTALHTIFPYSTNVLSMLEYPLKCKGEFNPILYGVELEVSTDYNVQQIIDATDLPYMAAKSDSSISGTKRHAMELVTVPMSLKCHKQQWAKWFSKLDYEKFDTTKSTTNGMHVHIGREFFQSTAHRRNFLWFFNNPANFDFMMALSERNAIGLQQYAKMANFGAAKKGNAYRNIENFVGLRGDRNVATNIQKGPTIEVRLFRGIVSYASVLKNLEAVDAVMHYTADLSMRQGNLFDFLTWLKKTPNNKYLVLKKFIEVTNMNEIVLGAQIKDILWTETDPQKIVAKMKASGLVITNAHVTYLNRSRKKRTFVLDKKTGELVVVMSDKGKVSGLDRELEKRYVNAA